MQTGYFGVDHPILTWCILGYILVAGLITWPTIRPGLMRIYRSHQLMPPGIGPIDQAETAVRNRIGFEFFILIVALIIGPLGGWVYAAYRWSRREH
jgi:hypothetical protein